MGLEWEKVMMDGTAGTVPARIYRGAHLTKAPPLVLHMHGGAFLDGSPASGQTVAALLAGAGAVVVSADYSSAIAEPFPRALELLFGVLASVCKGRASLASKKSALFVAGEEAGGNLAAGLALMARDQHLGALGGQILLSPMLNPCMATKSFRAADAGKSTCHWAMGWNRYLGFTPQDCHPYAAPAFCARLADVAPALVLSAEDDPMHDESLAYAARLKEAGVAVSEHVLTAPTGWPGSFADRGGVEPDWGETVRKLFVSFFQKAGALPTDEPPPNNTA